MKLRSVAPQWFHENPEKTAKCVRFPASKEYDPWYGDSEDEEDPNDEMEEAKAICNGTFDGNPCPLINQCLEFALDNNERYGVWGGMTPTERLLIRKARRTRKD